MRPAVSHELIALAIAHPFWQARFPIVTLDSIGTKVGVEGEALYLSGQRGGQRDLMVHNTADGFAPECRFAFVVDEAAD
jgi:hypothetical protein